MNTLAMTDKLKAAGVSDKEARAHVEVVQDATDELATTADLDTLEDKLDARMRDMEARMREMEARLQASIAKLQADMSKLILQATIGSLVATAAIFAFIVKTLVTGG